MGKGRMFYATSMGLTSPQINSDQWSKNGRPIEANVDVKTTDGYFLRVFCIAFTEKQQSQTTKTCYAQTQQIKNIRRKMVDIITRDVSGGELKDIVNKLVPDTMADDIRKACNSIYPLKDVHIRKVKVLKKPRFDLSKLLEMHGEGGGKSSVAPASGEDLGANVERH